MIDNHTAWKHNGVNVLLDEANPSALDGSIFWPSPQSDWNWPPPSAIEAMASKTEARALPEGLRRRLGLFKAANSLMLAVWMSGRGDNPLLREQADEFIAHQMEQMRFYGA